MQDESIAVKIARLEEQTADLHTDVHEIRSDVRDIKQSLHGRPSWAVAVVITFLSSLCVGLAVVIATAQ